MTEERGRERRELKKACEREGRYDGLINEGSKPNLERVGGKATAGDDWAGIH